MAGQSSDVSVVSPRPSSGTHNDARYDAIFIPQGLLIESGHKCLAQLLASTTVAQTIVEVLVMSQTSREECRCPQR